jgi:hypothetical protein
MRATKDKTNEKGKRKSEKHGALRVRGRALKNKKEKQTQKHDQQKRKRHRETGTLRQTCLKKSEKHETPSN